MSNVIAKYKFFLENYNSNPIFLSTVKFNYSCKLQFILDRDENVHNILHRNLTILSPTVSFY